jgi:hypothetical protein
MLLAHQLLLRIAGVSTSQPWQSTDGSLPSSPRRIMSFSHYAEIGEGGMYI